MSISRNTEARRAILDLINSTNKALSHADILLKVGAICDRVTVYRVLDRLLKEGKVHRVVGNDNKSYFAACQTCTVHNHFDGHAHFQCKKCHELKCLDVELSLPENLDDQVQELQILLMGICKNCHVITVED